MNLERTHRKDSKKYWKSVQLILPKAKTSGIEVIYDPDSCEVVGGITAANTINNYFSNIGEKLSGSLLPPTKEFWPTRTEMEFVWDYEILPSDIELYSKDFCPSKSLGIPGISSRLLLDFFLLKPEIMSNIFNKCLRTGIYPNLWKCSIMVPM